MPEDRSSDARGGFWHGLRSMLGLGEEPSLRDQLEEALDEADRVPAAGDLSPTERQMLKNLLHFGERIAGDVAVPRSDIIAFDAAGSFDELVALLREAGHSRVPVFRGALDHVIGMVHIKDVYPLLADRNEQPVSVESLLRPALFVPESMGVLDLLARMRAERTHLAIVVDEFGGTDGLITIEDLVEEIVGEIEDEHDEAPEGLLIPLGGGAFDADARLPVEELAEQVDARLADEEMDVDTLGGLVFMLAGRVPEPGESIEHDSGWRLEVLDADARRVARVRLHPPLEPAMPAAAGK